MKILVIGESCQDIFTYGKTERVCPEAACLVFSPSYTSEYDGMASNVLNNLYSLNPSANYKIVTSVIRPVKTRFIEIKSNSMLLRQDENDVTEELGLDEVADVLKSFEPNVTVVSDYAKGFLTPSTMQVIAKNSKLSFLDTKQPLAEWALGFSYIKINSQEFENSWNNIQGIEAFNEKLIVTVGEKGCRYKGVHYPVEPIIGGDLSGAGDTFLAALVCSYIHNYDIKIAIDFANECAGAVIKKKGVATI